MINNNLLFCHSYTLDLMVEKYARSIIIIIPIGINIIFLFTEILDLQYMTHISKRRNKDKKHLKNFNFLMCFPKFEYIYYYKQKE